MDFERLFLDRRSIRKYLNKAIDKETVEQILKAAMYAPSAVNCQPWHFVLVDDPDLLSGIQSVHPYASMLHTAPMAIVVCGDEHLQHDEGYWVVDCGAATQNILLAAHALGLGTCWVGLHPREGRKKDMSDLLGLPAHVMPFALVALGYPAEARARPERFQLSRIRYNHWDQSGSGSLPSH
jgi:nitroreductase